MPDPRLDSFLRFALEQVGSNGDPGFAFMREQIAEVRGRLDALERAPTVQVVASAPPGAARDGALAVDQTQPRLWVRRNGTWTFCPLTVI